MYGQLADTVNAKAPEVFMARSFNLDTVNFLTKKQLDEHIKLYKGYVARRNEIMHKLNDVEKSGNVTYTPYRALKIAETFARNGQLLHELYFEQLEGKPMPIGSEMEALIVASFGSVDKFYEDLKTAALSSRGWVMTAYDYSDRKLHNFVLDAHNETVPVGVMPVFITDVYEHAYFMDYGTNRAGYIESFLTAINWDVAEQRLKKLIQP